jgi:hypothetical protein
MSPITNPAVCVSTAINAALSAVVPSVGVLPAWGWLVADPAIAEALAAGAIPGLIIAYPTTPFSDDSTIGFPEVVATLVVKAIAATEAAAQALLAEAVAALAAPDALAPPAGIAVWLAWRAELPVPPGTASAAAAASYEVRVRRA